MHRLPLWYFQLFFFRFYKYNVRKLTIYLHIYNMELSIADYLIEVQFCIPFLCEEVNSWTEYFTVMVEEQICTPNTICGSLQFM